MNQTFSVLKTVIYSSGIWFRCKKWCLIIVNSYKWVWMSCVLWSKSLQYAEMHFDCSTKGTITSAQAAEAKCRCESELVIVNSRHKLRYTSQKNRRNKCSFVPMFFSCSYNAIIPTLSIVSRVSCLSCFFFPIYSMLYSWYSKLLYTPWLLYTCFPC